MLGPDMLEKMKALAKDALGGKEGAVDILIIEAPKGKASSPEKAMDYAKEVAGEENGPPDVPDAYKESKEEGSEESGDHPEGPLHSEVFKLIEDWDPQTPEGQQYLSDLQRVYDENKHGMKKEQGY